MSFTLVSKIVLSSFRVFISPKSKNTCKGGLKDCYLNTVVMIIIIIVIITRVKKKTKVLYLSPSKHPSSLDSRKKTNFKFSGEISLREVIQAEYSLIVA